MSGHSDWEALRQGRYAEDLELLERHKRQWQHHNPIHCSACDAPFPTWADLEIHSRGHNGFAFAFPTIARWWNRRKARR